MKLYDFSAYAKRRDESRSANQVEEVIQRLNEPGAVVELKQKVETYMVLHREVSRKIAS